MRTRTVRFLDSFSTVLGSTKSERSSVDADRALEIWRKAVDATHHFLSATDHQAIEAEVNAFLPQAPLCLAVDESDHPIGFMLLGGSHLETLFVDPAHDGTGAGPALVEHALRLHPTLTTTERAKGPHFPSLGQSPRDTGPRNHAG